MLGLISSVTYATSFAVRATISPPPSEKQAQPLEHKPLRQFQLYLGKRWTFIIVAICGVAGILVTYSFVKNLTSEDLGERDQRFKNYLVENGWEGETGRKLQ